MKEIRYELMSTLAAKSALEGHKSRTEDMSDQEYEMYEMCYDYWSKPENHCLAVKASR
jgi:hypothetical protein